MISMRSVGYCFSLSPSFSPKERGVGINFWEREGSLQLHTRFNNFILFVYIKHICLIRICFRTFESCYSLPCGEGWGGVLQIHLLRQPSEFKFIKKFFQTFSIRFFYL